MWSVWHISSCLCDSSGWHQNSRNTPNKINSIQDSIQIPTEEHFCQNPPKSANLHLHHVFTGFYSLSVWILIALDLKPCPSPYAGPCITVRAFGAFALKVLGVCFKMELKRRYNFKMPKMADLLPGYMLGCHQWQLRRVSENQPPPFWMKGLD